MAALDTALCRQREGEAEEAEVRNMRCFKLARIEPDMVAPEKVAPFFVPSSPHPFLPGGVQMLSFSSSSKEEETMLSLDGTSPCFHHPSASASTHSFLRNAGTLGENMHGVLARVKGPFTPAQWLELERQALIYKYMVANIAIPPSLLISTWRGLGPCRFPPYSAGYFGSSTLGWSQGFSGNEDPEPGRCRRTDGKKWRCSRDAVADQKYCERHMNRGRHRSRKHVEGRNSHAAKAMPAVAPSQSASTLSTGGVSCNATKSLHRAESFQTTDQYPGHIDRQLCAHVLGPPDGAHYLERPIRYGCSKVEASQDGLVLPSIRTKTGEGTRKKCTQDSESHCILGSSNLIPASNLLPSSKEHTPFEEASSVVELGLVSASFPSKPSSSSLSDNIRYADTSKINCQESEPCHLQNFIDEFPKNQFARLNIPWSGIGEIQSHRTQLSISVPRACSDFGSSFTSDDLANSPFKLLQGYNTVDMALGVGLSNEASKCQTGWIPISWESSVAGPLGEVLNNTSITPNEQCKNFFSSSINFLADGCDLNKWVVPSPTGVLHKATLGSVSSSTGSSSPRVENRNGSLCDDILGSTLVNLPTIPS